METCGNRRQWAPLILTLAILAAAPARAGCPVDFFQVQSAEIGDVSAKHRFDLPAVSAEIEGKIAANAIYRPVFSTDLPFVREEARFDEGPAPQRNLSIIPGREQLRINDQSATLFTLKKKLLARNRDKIIAVAPAYRNELHTAVQEQFLLVLKELPARYPQAFRRDGDRLLNLLSGDTLSLGELQFLGTEDGLERLGQMVLEDMIFMRKAGEEWVTVGGNVAFPGNWNLPDVTGETVTEMHRHLNESQAITQEFSRMINKSLDMMIQTGATVRRNNWYLMTDPRYALPNYRTTSYDGPAITASNWQKAVFLRSERHTLRPLVSSGMVVFALQPNVYPLGSLIGERFLAEKLLRGIEVKLLPEADTEAYVRRTARYLEKHIAEHFGVHRTKVVSSQALTGAHWIVRLEKPSGFAPVAGEAVKLTLITPRGEITRVFSLASSPDQPYVEFAVKDSVSDFKTELKTLKRGSRVKIERMKAGLAFDSDAPAVMIAGGIGITPFRSFIQQVSESDANTPMWLLYGNRSEIPFGDELAELAESNSNLSVTNVMSQADAGWGGARGRIDHAFLAGVIPQVPADARYYIVAGSQMTQDVRAALLALGIPESRIAIEVFESLPPDPTGSAAMDFGNVSDAQTICNCHRVTAGVLRAAIQAGAGTLPALQAQTRAGTLCGNCKTRINGLLQYERQSAGSPSPADSK